MVAVVRVEAGSHTASREGKAQLETDRDRTEPTARQGRGAGRSNISSASAKLASLMVHAATRRLGIIAQLNCRWNSGTRPRC